MSSTDGETGMKKIWRIKRPKKFQDENLQAVESSRTPRKGCSSREKRYRSPHRPDHRRAQLLSACTAQKQARRGYKQARANVDSAVDDLSDRGGAMMDAAQDAASTIEETLEDVITQRPLATVGIALGLGFLIGATWRRWDMAALTRETSP